MQNTLQKKIMKLKQWTEESSNIVFFGGVGVSTVITYKFQS